MKLVLILHSFPRFSTRSFFSQRLYCRRFCSACNVVPLLLSIYFLLGWLESTVAYALSRRQPS